MGVVSPDPEQRLASALKDLKGCEEELTIKAIRESAYKGSDLLYSLYRVKLDCGEIPPNVCGLIHTSINSIVFAVKFWVMFTNDHFPPENNLASSKRERLGLHFLLDIIKNGDKEKHPILKENLEEFWNVEEWDENFKDMAEERSEGLEDDDIIAYDISVDEKEKLVKEFGRELWWCFYDYDAKIRLPKPDVIQRPLLVTLRAGR